jgi:hypothetical protein
MAKLGSRFYEINRGYKKISDTYARPYLIGVDILEREKPFVVAMGDRHSDSSAILISIDELLSGRWDEHIVLSNSIEFVKELKRAVNEGEPFPQKFIRDLVNK